MLCSSGVLSFQSLLLADDPYFDDRLPVQEPGYSLRLVRIRPRKRTSARRLGRKSSEEAVEARVAELMLQSVTGRKEPNVEALARILHRVDLHLANMRETVVHQFRLRTPEGLCEVSRKKSSFE